MGMDREKGQGSRLRKVAVTGMLTPGLVLGLVGASAFVASPVSAHTAMNGECQAFGAPDAASSTMSVADVAEQTNPAVVTVLNLQPLSQASMNQIPGIEGIPGLPELPGTDEAPSGEGAADEPAVDESESNQAVPVGSGSGFIVDAEGHVVTNAHVVAGAEEVLVTYVDGTEVPATVVGSDRLIDVAVLKLDLPAGESVPAVAKFGNSTQMRPGDQVVAIGTALGEFPNTVSEGTINGVHRDFQGMYPLAALIQHDAEIWHGNSGGPLLNLSGQVVGVNVAGIGSGMMGADTGSADMAFAVEGNTICNAAAQLIAEGKIAWPYLGIEGESGPEGQTVLGVEETGPAAAAGLEAGDVITAFAGQELDQQHTLLDLLFDQRPGDVVEVTVDRDGTPWTFEVTLGERPDTTE
jgi:S1-C subfamily serine protease